MGYPRFLHNCSNILSGLALILVVITISSCKKTDIPLSSNSAILTFGMDVRSDLSEIIPTSDGGFVIGFHDWRNGNQDIGVRKYGPNSELEWERIVGHSRTEELGKIIQLSNQNIVIVGTSYGFGQDSIRTDTSLKMYQYQHCFDHSGQTVYERGYSHNMLEGANFKVADAIETSNGTLLTDLFGSYVFKASTIAFETDLYGELISSIPFFTAVYELTGALEGVNHYIFERRSMTEPGFVIYDKANFHRINNEGDLKVVSIDLDSLMASKTFVYVISDKDKSGKFNTSYFYSNGVFQIQYEELNDNITSTVVPFKDFEVIDAYKEGKKTVLYSAKNELITVDENFKVVSKFQSNFDVPDNASNFSIISLTKGGYAICFQVSHEMYLVLLNENGQLK